MKRATSNPSTGLPPNANYASALSEDQGLPSALDDLDRGRQFYARQGESIGDYFLNSLISDIDSLELYAGIHRKAFDFYRLIEAFSLCRVLPSRGRRLRCISRAGLSAEA